MPKNKIGGKHKHLKKDDGNNKKFDFIEPDTEGIYYAYVGKCYGNRQFDVILLKNKKKVRMGVPLKRRKKRIAEGNLIKICKAECFTKETYCYEEKCEENEVNFVANSDEYGRNYKSIKGSYDLFVNATSDGVYFTKNEVEEVGKKVEISYEDVLDLSDEDDDEDDEDDEDYNEELNIDDL